MQIPIGSLREALAYHHWAEQKLAKIKEMQVLLAIAEETPERSGGARKAYKEWVRVFWTAFAGTEEKQEARMRGVLDRVKGKAISIRSRIDLDDNMDLSIEAP